MSTHSVQASTLYGAGVLRDRSERGKQKKLFPRAQGLFYASFLDTGMFVNRLIVLGPAGKVIVSHGFDLH